ncbi:MAG: hypothetical protein SGJ16_06635 [Nitrospirota bacterium]|nr:hypothetical protein [Nitrospirota bacterium]
MTQWVIVWMLLIGAYGLISVIVLDLIGDDQLFPHDNRQGSPSLEHQDGEELHERSFGQSKIAA